MGSGNLGDYVINSSIRREMKFLNDNAFVLELPSHTKTFGPVQKVAARKAVKEFAEADLKFLCGTNAIYTNMIRPNLNWKINFLDNVVQRGTILLGAGIGINRKQFNLYTSSLWKKVLSKKYIHSVRDLKTKEYLDKIGIESICTGCPTTWRFTEQFLADVPREKAKEAVFTLTCYNKDYAYDKKMIDVLLRNYDRLYFFAQTFGDVAYLNELLSQEELSEICVIGGNLDAYDSLLSGTDLDYIGSRLHGGMYALQHKKRAIVISIDYRASNMLIDSNIVIDRKNSSAEDLENIINSRFGTRMEIPLDDIAKWKAQFEI